MKNTLDHLPKLKQKELSSIVSIIQANCDDVEMIILFGSYARGDYNLKGDLSPGRKSGHVSDFDILVVTEHKETVDKIDLWDEITKICSQMKLSAHTRLIAHDIQDLNIKLAEGQYFFSDIKKEGRVLFNSTKFRLASERDLTPVERQRIAQDHFDHWFEKAKGFHKNYFFNIQEKEYKLAAFMLHQSAESSYKAVLLVFTNYNPNEHWLAALSEMVIEQDDSFSNIFPLETKEEKNRFTLLDYAYIGARYDPKYRISKDDIQILAESVKKLLKRTEKVCIQKIRSFNQR